jgi:heme-degrading monooxygenase HmoA
MFVVIFEVEPRTGRVEQYLDLALQLKLKLEAMDGFIEVERFRNRKAAGRLLSISSWRDEKSLIRWRTQREHQAVQRKARNEVFADYRLRVGEITSDDALPNGTAMPQQRFDPTGTGEAKTCSITEVLPQASLQDPAAPSALGHPAFDSTADGLVDQELYESIHHVGKLLVLASWRDDQAAAAWNPPAFGAAGEIRHRLVRVIRDYGMYERREAPQYYPEAARVTANQSVRLA